MSQHEAFEIKGRVGDIFLHRFVIETSDGRKTLADLGPKGADAIRLEPGMEIVAEGEMKPSELKVRRIAIGDGAPIVVPHRVNAHDDGGDQPRDPSLAQTAVRDVGSEPFGEPRRKPKHFEVLARRGGDYIECHVGFDGHIRKEKPVDPRDDKWADEIRAVV